MTSTAVREVPAEALATVLAIVESLHGRDDGTDTEEFADTIEKSLRRWGDDTITQAFGLLINAALTVPDPEDDSDDLLHTLVPAMITRLRHLELAEVPQTELPTVAAMLTAAFLGQDPYQWRCGLGPIPRQEILVWCYTAWLLADFMDEVVFAQPGRFAEVVTEMAASGGHRPG